MNDWYLIKKRNATGWIRGNEMISWARRARRSLSSANWDGQVDTVSINDKMCY